MHIINTDNDGLRYKLEKLDLSGTQDKKEIVLLKFSEDGTQIK